LHAAIPANAYPQLVEAFQNPQALIDPTAQATLRQLVTELGGTAATQLQHLTDAAHAALIAGVRVGYILALGLSVINLVLILMLRTPNFRAVTAPRPVNEEPMVEAV
jgi:hypothetical protein